MSVPPLARVCIWLPILIPALIVGGYLSLGLSLVEGIVVELLWYSLLVGGVPYSLLALWATWWVVGRPEPAIRRLMFFAPLLMVALFGMLALTAGLVVGQVRVFAAVAGLGSALILVLGYLYVLLTMTLRWQFGPRLTA